MYRLIFQPHRIPRTTTREEWQDIWRWRRVTERTLNDWAKKHRQILAKHAEDGMIFGFSTLMIEDLINPPVLIYPDLPQNQSIDLRPGGISYVE
jgi:hypothetical protein